MANSWAPDGAVQDQIEDGIRDALDAARSRIPSGESREDCEACGENLRRHRASGTATTNLSAINRRGSKDIQR